MLYATALKLWLIRICATVLIHHMHEWRLVDFLLNLSALIRIRLIHFDEKRQETAHIAAYPVTHLWLRAT